MERRSTGEDTEKQRKPGSEVMCPRSFPLKLIYLLLRPTSQRMRATTSTIRIMAVQKPALKMPPTISQELSAIVDTITSNHKIVQCFIRSSFRELVQKLCRFVLGEPPSETRDPAQETTAALSVS